MNESIPLVPIGRVVSERSEPIDDDWDQVACSIELDPGQFDSSSLAGIDSFSHVEVLFTFHLVPEHKVISGARHPRDQKHWPLVGIFAQRSKNRPNRLGATICKVLGVDGLTLHVQGLDAINGTPVLDIKPVLAAFLPRGEHREPDWAREITSEYWSL